jgi:hypothetical protein
LPDNCHPRGPEALNRCSRSSGSARTLLEIAVPGLTDAGTWQDSAWRWALCHLLANNPNYPDRFVPLITSSRLCPCDSG